LQVARIGKTCTSCSICKNIIYEGRYSRRSRHQRTKTGSCINTGLLSVTVHFGRVFFHPENYDRSPAISLGVVTASTTRSNGLRLFPVREDLSRPRVCTAGWLRYCTFVGTAKSSKFANVRPPPKSNRVGTLTSGHGSKNHFCCQRITTTNILLCWPRLAVSVM